MSWHANQLPFNYHEEIFIVLATEFSLEEQVYICHGHDLSFVPINKCGCFGKFYGKRIAFLLGIYLLCIRMGFMIFEKFLHYLEFFLICSVNGMCDLKGVMVQGVNVDELHS